MLPKIMKEGNYRNSGSIGCKKIKLQKMDTSNRFLCSILGLVLSFIFVPNIRGGVCSVEPEMINYVMNITIVDVVVEQNTNCLNFDGSILITANGTDQTQAIQYSIDGGGSFQNSNLFVNLEPGFYLVAVQYQDGSSPTLGGNFEIESVEEPIISEISKNHVTDCGADDGSIFINASVDNDGIEFSINGGLNYSNSSFFSNLSAGTYDIVVRRTGSDCVTNTIEEEINSPIEPQINSVLPIHLTSCGADDGQIFIEAVGNQGDFEYSIDGGQSWQASPNFNGLSSGYFVPGIRNASDDTCEQIGGNIILNSQDGPEIEMPLVGIPSSCMATDGEIEVVFSNGGIGDFDFSINNGITWQSENIFNALASGTYIIKMRTTDLSCEVLGPTVNIEGGVLPNIVNDFIINPSDCDEVDGLITIIVDNDFGDFEYSIDGGVNWQNSNSFTELTEGIYQPRVRNGSICMSSYQEITLSEPDDPIISNIMVFEPTNCGLENGQIIIMAEEGSGSFSYSINGGQNFQSGNTFTGLAPGIYEVAVRNSDGTCEIINSELTNVPTRVAPGINDVLMMSPTECNSFDGKLTIVGQGGNSTDFEYSIDNGQSWQSNNEFDGLLPDLYFIGIRNGDGTCEILGSSVELLSEQYPEIADIQSVSPSGCNATNGSIELIIEGNGVYEYSIDGDNFQLSNVFNGLGPGTYSIKIQTIDESCVNEGVIVNLTSDIGYIVDVNVSVASNCSSSNGMVEIQAAGNVEYSIDGTNYQASNIFTDLEIGLYQPTIRSLEVDCVIEWEVINLTAIGQPDNPSFYTLNPTGCNGSDGLLTVIVDNDTGSFLYSANGGNTFQGSNTFENLPAGQYNIVIRSATCEVDGGVVSLQESTPGVIENIDFEIASHCESNDGTITITASGDFDLQYSIDGGLNYQNENDFTSLSGGDYTPAIRYSDGTCIVMGQTIDLSSENEIDIVNISILNSSGCDFEDGSIVITAIGNGELIEYSIDNGNSFHSTFQFENIGLGNYYVKVRYQGGTCESDAQLVQLINVEAPTIEDVSFNHPSACGESDGIIVIVTQQATDQFEYSIDGGQTFVENNGIENLGSGIYDILVRNLDGTCAVFGGQVVLEDIGAPLINGIITQNISDCDNTSDGFITIQAFANNNPLEYSIDGGLTYQNSNSFTNLNAGEFDLIVRQVNNGCEAIAQVELSQPEIAIVNDVTDINSDCGEENGTIEISVSGGQAPFEYSIDGGQSWQTSSLFDLLGAEDLEILVRNQGSQCVSEVTEFSLLANDGFVYDDAIVSQPTGNMLSDGSIEIIAMVCGDIDIEYSINDGEDWTNNPIFGSLPIGSYQILLRDSNNTNNAINGETVVLFFDNGQGPNIQLQAQNTSCGLNNGNITVVQPVNEAGFSYSIDGENFVSSNVFNQLMPGEYEIYVRNESNQEIFPFDQNPINISSSTSVSFFSSIVQPDCNTNNGEIILSASGGQGLYQYTINGGLNWVSTQSFTNLNQGTYTVAVRNANGSCVTAYQTIVLAPEDGIVIDNIQLGHIGCGSTTGSITIFAEGMNQNNIVYSIDNGVTFQEPNSFEIDEAGDYNIVVQYEDGTCQSATLNRTINEITSIQGFTVEVLNTGCNMTTGTIIIELEDDINLEYSIDNGATFSLDNTFEGLEMGEYQIVLQAVGGFCPTNAGIYNIENNDNAGPSNIVINTIEPFDCASQFGEIVVSAEGFDDMEYTIDGGENWQVTPVFSNLGNGDYSILVRYTDGSCATEFENNPVVFNTNNAENVFYVEEIIATEVPDPIKVCIPSNLGSLNSFDLTSNGETYIENLTACDDVIETSFYFGDLLPIHPGPYLIESWTTDLGVFSGEVDNFEDFINRMNEFDPEGNWAQGAGSVVRGGRPDGTYSNINVSYGSSNDIVFTVILADTGSTPTGSCFAFDEPGQYEILATSDEGCADTVLVIIPTDMTITTDTVYLETLINTNSETFCLSSDDLPSGEILSIDYCGGPDAGNVPQASTSCFFYVPQNGFLGQEQFCLVGCEVGGEICDTTIYFINVVPPSNTIVINMVANTSVDTCLTIADLTLPGTLQNGATSVGNLDSQALNIITQDNCINIDPVEDFTGDTEFYIVHCDDTTPGPVCDTTFFVINVSLDCEEIFFPNQQNIESLEPFVEICIPVPQLEIINDYQLIVDGQLQGNPPLPCNEELIYIYPFFLEEINETDVFDVSSWDVNGNDEIFIVTGISALLNMMEAIDLGSEWQYSETFNGLIGGNPASSYGTLSISINGGAVDNSQPDNVGIGQGGLITVNGFGEHEIVLTHENGCSDTLFINLVEDETTQVTHLTTPFNTTIEEICADDSLLPGEYNGEVGYCQVPSNGSSPIITDGLPCVQYIPFDGWIGLDTLCLTLCNEDNDTCIDYIYYIETLAPDCELFNPSDFSLQTINGTTDLCVPIPELTIINDFEVALDGTVYNGPSGGCDPMPGFVYNYEGLPDGNYQVLLWEVNGEDYSWVSNSLESLVDSLNQFDPNTTWELDEDGSNIVGYNTSNTYSNINISISGNPFIISGEATQIAVGTVFVFEGLGPHELIFFDIENTCTDTITVNLVDQNLIVNIVTNEDIADTTCINTEMFPNTTEVTICGQTTNGSLSVIDDLCVVYTPNTGFYGDDEGCITICDDEGNCTDLTWDITVNPICPDNVFYLSYVDQFINDCEAMTEICIPVDTDESPNYLATLNGMTIDLNTVQTCQPENINFYDFGHLPNRLNEGNGPYNVSSVNIDGAIYGGEFTSAFALVDSLNAWDGSNSWTLDANYSLIINSDNADNYGTMVIDVDGTSYVLSYLSSPNNGYQFTLDIGQHELELVNNADNCRDSIIFDLYCTRFEDIVIDTIVHINNPDTLCLEDLGISTVGINSLTSTCEPNATENVTFTYDQETNCIILNPQNVGLDTFCLEICNNTECIDLTLNVEVLEACEPFFEVENVGLGLTDCEASEGFVCIPIPETAINQFSIFVDEIIYVGPRAQCDLDTIYRYNYTAVEGQGVEGPYEVTFTVDGVSFLDTFETTVESLVLLQQNDPLGMWTLDSANNRIIGGNLASTYALIVKSLVNNNTDLPLTLSLQPRGTGLLLPQGVSHLVFVHNETGCQDTLISTVNCAIFVELPINSIDTICVDTTALQGNYQGPLVNNCPDESGENASLTFIDDQPCFIVTGLEVGQDSACVVVCDDLDNCFTTSVIINVANTDSNLPDAVDDNITTGQNQPVVINPFANDTINGSLDTFYIAVPPVHGDAIFGIDGSLNYVPNEDYCNSLSPDSITYVLCNTVGCDSAVVYINIECEGIIVFDGFSPNSDGINENFFIQGIGQYPDSELTIFNRWGNRVYQKVGYLNDWSGTWDEKDLPDGTYFYILKLHNTENSEYNGWLQISR